MSDGRRRGWIGALLVAVAALVAWLLWPRDDDAPPRPTPAAVDARPPAPRDRRASAETSPRSSTDVPSSADDPKPLPASAPDTKDAAKTFDVLVRRADGTPAPAAQVETSSRSLWGEWPDSTSSAVADAQGRAALPFPTRGLVFARLGAESGWARAVDRESQRAKPTEIRMKPGVVVRGRTIDSDGRPVAGATVRASMAPSGAGATLVVEAVSDADGAFESPPLPFEEWWSGPQEIEVVASAAGLAPGGLKTTRAAAAKEPVVVTLYRGGALRGRFVFADGQPATSAHVVLVGADVATSADKDGRFVLRLPRDGGEVVVHDRLTGTSDSAFRQPSGTWIAPRRLGAFRGDAGDRDLGDVVLDAGKPVRGVVVAADGQPIARATVSVSLAGSQVIVVHADAKGAFELPLSDDEHDVVAVENRSSTIWWQRRAVARGVRGGGADLRLVVGVMGIVVRLRSEDGSKIEGTVASLSVYGMLRGHPTGLRTGNSIGGVKVDDVRVEFKQEGAWDLVVEAAGFEPTRVDDVVVRADRDAEIEVRLRKKRD